MNLELLVWVGGGLLELVLCFFGNEPRLGRKSSILHHVLRVCVIRYVCGVVITVSIVYHPYLSNRCACLWQCVRL